MAAICKYCVVIGVAIVFLSQQTDAQQNCTKTTYHGPSLPCHAVDCGNLTNPANGHVSYTAETTYEWTATYICNTGYNLVGNSTRTCLARGVWSGSVPTCQAVDCDTLADPINGQVTHTAGMTLGQTATYSCNTGYNLVGNSTRTCQATGVWSGSEPTCQDMNECTSGIHGCNLHATCHNTQGSYTCSCNRGYTGNGFTCTVVSCGALANPGNGRVGHTGKTFGQTATYSCNTGYNLVGVNTCTCQATGVWSGSSPTCQVVSCGALANPANGRVAHTAGTTFGQTATYSCNTGYNLVGVNTRTCQATRVWSGSAPTCEVVNCGTLNDPANGRVHHTGGRTLGRTATYSCNIGYNLVGSSTHTCQATRVWSGSAPTCQAVDCGTLTNPANGQVTYTAGTLFGQTATYSCDSGYNLVGVSVRTCQATGVWSGSVPTCQAVNCDTLTKPANGQVSHTAGTTFGQTATYSCDTGYDLVGDNTRMCQATGVWSENAPVCHDVNECTEGTDSCHDNATCHNTQGSYNCSCNSGYTGNGFSCTDFNECLSDNGGCHHNCHNSDGSYICSCNNGYRLDSDGQTCEASIQLIFGVTGGGGMLIIIATALITVSFIIIKTKHASKKSGTLQTTSTMNVSQSALDAEDSTPPIPQKLFLDDEFGDDPPPPIPPKLFLDDEFDDNPPPPIPPKLFLDNEDYSLPISHMKLPKSRGPQQTGSQVSLDNQNKQMDIKMKQNVSYEVPSSVMKMTDCAAYGTLPN